MFIPRSYQKTTFHPIALGGKIFLLLGLLLSSWAFCTTKGCIDSDAPIQETSIHIVEGAYLINFPEVQPQNSVTPSQNKTVVYVSSGAQIINLSQESDLNLKKLPTEKSLAKNNLQKKQKKETLPPAQSQKEIIAKCCSKIESPISDQNISYERYTNGFATPVNNVIGDTTPTHALSLLRLIIYTKPQSSVYDLRFSNNPTAFKVRPPPTC